MELGRVCVKIAGRETGKKCVVLGTEKDGMLVVCGPGVRKRRCNPVHLKPLSEIKNVKKDASEKEIYALFGIEYKEKVKKAPTAEKKEEKKEEKPKPEPKKEKPKKAKGKK